MKQPTNLKILTILLHFWCSRKNFPQSCSQLTLLSYWRSIRQAQPLYTHLKLKILAASQISCGEMSGSVSSGSSIWRNRLNSMYYLARRSNKTALYFLHKNNYCDNKDPSNTYNYICLIYFWCGTSEETICQYGIIVVLLKLLLSVDKKKCDTSL